MAEEENTTKVIPSAPAQSEAPLSEETKLIDAEFIEEFSPKQKSSKRRRKISDVSVITVVEGRLISAASAQEIVLWTQVRAEVLRQNSTAKDQNHRQLLERIQLLYKTGFSLVAFIVGIFLLIYGFSYTGLFIIGAGLFGIAPEYVIAFFVKRSKEGQVDER